MKLQALPESEDEILDQMAHLVGDVERHSFFRRRPELATARQLEHICAEVNRQVGISSDRAIELAATARLLADLLGVPALRGLATRAAANAYHFAGRTELAQELYDLALQIFESLDDKLGAAITRSSALTNLAYLGELDRVYRFEKEARVWFEQLGDRLRLAILDNNLANILARQDRWAEALERYRAAHQEFVAQGRAQDAAICLRNIASCHVCLHHFQEALEVYQQNRAYCLAEGLDRLVVESDYNIAYLYFLRGEYTRAIGRYEAAREDSVRAGDDYHQALCDLDLSEIYLELNLADDAARLAQSAHLLFHRLKLAYESAKALTNAALAESRCGQHAKALEQLAGSRRIFEREGNHLWPALVDYYRAVLLGRSGRPSEAVAAARAAYAAFADSGVAHRALLCQILLSALLLDQNEPEEARRVAGEALDRLRLLELPALEQLAWRMLGRSEEERGEPQAALAAYRQALDRLEQLRGQLLGEDLKIAFLQDKRALYEGLFCLTLAEEKGNDRFALAFGYVEKAKSRSLLEMLAFRASSLRSHRRESEEISSRTRQLREELSWHYRQLDRALMNGAAASEIAKLRSGARHHEDELLRHLRRLQMADHELGSLQVPAPFDLEACRRSLPPDTALVEYFVARERVYAAILLPNTVEVIELCSEVRCREKHRLLQFELSRCVPGRPAPAGLDTWIDRAISEHLRTLGAMLFEPLQAHLQGTSKLILAPHAFLHYLPFHALEVEAGTLVDLYEISYSPSAAVFQLGQAKAPTGSQAVHLLGVADARAPHIADEIATLREVLPEAVVHLGEDADEEALRQASGSRFVHIATHALFRRDNPMFSAIQLGKSRLSLFDLYDLELDADLVTLSGCGTGLNAVLGADELVGLARGLLYAGARSLLLTLWDVHDHSTARLMTHFYREMAAGSRPAPALRAAMRRHREDYPRPYYWASFVLVGQP